MCKKLMDERLETGREKAFVTFERSLESVANKLRAMMMVNCVKRVSTTMVFLSERIE